MLLISQKLSQNLFTILTQIFFTKISYNQHRIQISLKFSCRQSFLPSFAIFILNFVHSPNNYQKYTKCVKFSYKLYKIFQIISEILLKIPWNFLKNWMKYPYELSETFFKIVWNFLKNGVKFFWFVKIYSFFTLPNY